MRGHCFAWMANVLAMAKKIVWTLNVAMSVTTGQSHVRAFDVQFGVLVSNLDQRLRPLIFDIQSHFLIEVPSHFVRASGCFSGTWWRRSNRKARPTESWPSYPYPDCWRRRLSFTTSASEVTSSFKSLWELWLLQCFFVLRCLNLCLRLSMFVGWEGRAMSRELLRNTFVYSKCVSNYFNNSSTFFRQIA